MNTGKSLRSLTATLAFAAFAVSVAQADLLGVYEFGSGTTGSLNATSVASGVSFSSVTNSPTPLTNFFTTLNGAVDNRILNTAPSNSSSTTLALAITNDSYFQFTVTPDIGQTINLGSISFDVARGGSSARGFGLATSVDNYSSPLSTANYDPLVGVTSQQPTYTNYSFDLSSFAPISTATTFRLYVWAPTTGSTVFFDNIAVTAVPEPSVYGMVGLACIGLALIRSRRVRRDS